MLATRGAPAPFFGAHEVLEMKANLVIDILVGAVAVVIVFSVFAVAAYYVG